MTQVCLECGPYRHERRLRVRRREIDVCQANVPTMIQFPGREPACLKIRSVLAVLVGKFVPDHVTSLPLGTRSELGVARQRFTEYAHGPPFVPGVRLLRRGPSVYERTRCTASMPAATETAQDTHTA